MLDCWMLELGGLIFQMVGVREAGGCARLERGWWIGLVDSEVSLIIPCLFFWTARRSLFL